MYNVYKCIVWYIDTKIHTHIRLSLIIAFFKLGHWGINSSILYIMIDGRKSYNNFD